MIRNFEEKDLDAVCAIWLKANIDAHDFIPAAYWQENLAAVRQMLPQATLFVAEQAGQIVAFLGLSQDYVAGLFVDSALRGGGIGKRLLEHAKGLHAQLNLSVFKDNGKATRFYQREGFVVTDEGIDAATGAIEYHMMWKEDSDESIG